MLIEIPIEFKEILLRIEGHNLTEELWAEIESSDMFQSEIFCGGFDADENEFCFSFYERDRNEYWFQFPLDEVRVMLELEKIIVETCKV
ncbi:hypothetical protein N480_22450 [Pseudoalteromonas luteoviolacea S2607]|uniref:hypothetical protein n=1 Tax=Pseudoalteromonas luteoviolacea TaxID=43657 RepID=UPI0007B07B35|nr:hypothetical protein [Pseudoalteromonas luteoviolacea]KZN34367.1 hypothetical protein N480_22450 [Pseudoalteromonas luteoviolacea S2607]